MNFLEDKGDSLNVFHRCGTNREGGRMMKDGKGAFHNFFHTCRRKVKNGKVEMASMAGPPKSSWGASIRSLNPELPADPGEASKGLAVSKSPGRSQGWPGPIVGT